MLTQAEIDFLAQKGSWYVDCLLKHNIGLYSPMALDWVILVGDGVDDLDRMERLMTDYPYGRFLIDIGRTESAYRVFSKEDLAGLRTAYITFNGTVNKPPIVEDDIESVAFGL